MCGLVWPAAGLMAQSLTDDIEQLQLDVQKLAQLKAILTEMYQEYELLHTGYERIKNLSQGTFDLHKAFLDGLLLVSPVVSGYPKVLDIVTKEANLMGDYQAAYGYFQRSGQFTPQELTGMALFYGNLVARCATDVEELTMLVTSGQLRMSDGERLTAIDRVDGNVTGQLALLHSFDDAAALQVVERAQEAKDVGAVRGLYGVGW